MLILKLLINLRFMEDKAKELLNRVDKYLQDTEGGAKENIDTFTLLNDFLLPGLQNTKDVLSSISSYQVKKRGGLVGKLKSYVQQKLTNSTINVIEKQAIKQQKFNDLVFKTLEILIKEKSK